MPITSLVIWNIQQLLHRITSKWASLIYDTNMWLRHISWFVSCPQKEESDNKKTHQTHQNSSLPSTAKILNFWAGKKFLESNSLSLSFILAFHRTNALMAYCTKREKAFKMNVMNCNEITNRFLWSENNF